MRRGRYFQRGAGGVFSCAVCGRRARVVEQGNPEICSQCWDIAGIDNTVNDDGRAPTPGELAECEALLAEIVKKGGSAEEVKKQNTYIWPKS